MVGLILLLASLSGEEQCGKMFTIVDEPISVLVAFSSGKIVPKSFIWRGEKLTVERITYAWRSKIGEATILHFAVTNKGSIYEISYNLKTFSWKLDKIHE